MRNKLALIIALAGFAVVTALGVGLAGADSAADLGGGDAITVTPATGPALNEVPECENELDDDGDALVDMEDPAHAGHSTTGKPFQVARLVDIREQRLVELDDGGVEPRHGVAET